MLGTWAETAHWQIDHDGLVWLVERDRWGEYRCLTRCGPVEDLDAIRDKLSRDGARVAPSAWEELEGLRERFLAADRREDLHAEWSAGYYASR